MGEGPLADFVDLVRRATGHVPYPYQTRLALEGFPEVLAVPTGSGKTLAAVLPWLFRRRLHPDAGVRASTARRLVFVLPMRVLVEQTTKSIEGWFDALGAAAADVQVATLLGGEPRTAPWRMAPESDMVIIGTLDMVMSRAINRGYGESRFVWPVDFGLLNSDCHYVFDEVQLMGPALATSRQLDGLRRALGTATPCTSMWMSATVSERDLATVDAPTIGARIELSSQDLTGALGGRTRAGKRVERWTLGGDPTRYAAEVAERLCARHRAGTLTILVANTVRTARQFHSAIVKHGTEADVVLLHSRFRPPDRRARVDAALRPVDADGPGRIIVSTQVIEAGVDLSATLLVTEAAPWPSIVQRAGRCNRDGSAVDAVLAWLEPPRPEPYAMIDLDRTIEELTALEGQVCTPSSLGAVQVDVRPEIRPILRRRDLLELFDTLPDLSGNDLDVSRFIREADDLDVSVAWWDIPDSGIDAKQPLPGRDERCPVPLRDLRDHVKKRELRPWMFDPLDSTWRRCRAQDLRPGVVIVLPVDAGGYDPLVGWAEDAPGPVPPVQEPEPELMDDRAMDDDPASFRAGHWVPLVTHLADVERELRALIDQLAVEGLTAPMLEAAVSAARLHDIGKAHEVFQTMLRRSAIDDEDRVTLPPEGVVLAKSKSGRGPRPERRFFRHELASALALLDAGSIALDEVDERDLAVYLVAAHHGRVRMGFRPLPGESPEAGRPVALGIHDGEVLPAVEVPGGVVPESFLHLKPMELGSGDGRPSWAAMALTLRDRADLGPFRLAWLEAVVRIADWRASAGPTIERDTSAEEAGR
jgi:CRISPR-associated endonuclease/helicase Cas3